MRSAFGSQSFDQRARKGSAREAANILGRLLSVDAVSEARARVVLAHLYFTDEECLRTACEPEH